MTDARHITIAVVLMLLFGAACCLVGYDIGKHHHRHDNTVAVPLVDTVRILTTDTMFVRLPPDTILATHIKIRKVAVHDTVRLIDSVFAELPFEQHFARLDDVANVWYSGYEARIDSAMVFKTKTTEIVNHYISESAPRNMVSITAGAVDASLGYLHRFGPVWVGASAGYTYAGQPTVRGSVGFQF